MVARCIAPCQRKLENFVSWGAIRRGLKLLKKAGILWAVHQKKVGIGHGKVRDLWEKELFRESNQPLSPGESQALATERATGTSYRRRKGSAPLRVHFVP